MDHGYVKIPKNLSSGSDRKLGAPDDGQIYMTLFYTLRTVIKIYCDMLEVGSISRDNLKQPQKPFNSCSRKQHVKPLVDALNLITQK